MFRDLKLSGKLYLAFGTVLAVLAVLIVSAYSAFSQVNDTVAMTNHTYQVEMEAGKLLTALVNIETGQRGFLLAGQDSFLEPLEQGKSGFQSSFDKIVMLTHDNSSQQGRLQKLAALQKTWLDQTVQPTLDMRRQVSAGVVPMDALMAKVAKGEGKALLDQMRTLLAEIGEAEGQLLVERSARAERAKHTMDIALLGGGGIAAVLAMGIAFAVARSLSVRIHRAVEVANLAAKGDFSSQAKMDGNDEIGALLHAFNDMQQQLRSLLSQVRESAHALLSSAEVISTASSQVSVGALEQSHAASSMAAAVEQLTVSINHVAENASEAHGVTMESGKISAEGSQVISMTVSNIQTIASTVQAASANLTDLGAHAAQISGIVNVIKDIADQTNLLALNAAIEAARAGETGRGFAVVADEVRKLAERTTLSTGDISTMVGKIQAGTEDAVRSMEESVAKVAEGVMMANEAGTAITQIRSGSDRVISVVADISHMLKEQTAVANTVAASVEKIAQMSQDAQQTIETTAHAASELRTLASQLDLSISHFKLA